MAQTVRRVASFAQADSFPVRRSRVWARPSSARNVEDDATMKRFLVCLDGSKRAPHVLATAVDLARRSGAKIRLFRAVGIPAELPASFYSMSPNDIPNVLLESARSELATASGDVPPELLEGILTQVGVPWDAICSAAREHDVDLIVIGSHGYSGLDRILGTTAGKVVNHADRSVMVVRKTAP